MTKRHLQFTMVGIGTAGVQALNHAHIITHVSLSSCMHQTHSNANLMKVRMVHVCLYIYLYMFPRVTPLPKKNNNFNLQFCWLTPYQPHVWQPLPWNIRKLTVTVHCGSFIMVPFFIARASSLNSSGWRFLGCHGMSDRDTPRYTAYGRLISWEILLKWMMNGVPRFLETFMWVQEVPRNCPGRHFF